MHKSITPRAVQSNRNLCGLETVRNFVVYKNWNHHLSTKNSTIHVKLLTHQIPRFGIASSSHFQIHSSSKGLDVARVTERSVFEEMCTGTNRKYIMISGKGGVGKTSLAASLAVKLAEAGHKTLVVSTDPAHSLGDSFDQKLEGGKPVLIEQSLFPLWGMEIDPDEARRQFKSFASSEEGKEMGKKAKSFAEGVGFSFDDLADLKLNELLDSPPPGLDEAMALSKVFEFVSKDEYAKFTRIIFDTAPTGHTIRLLALPDFVGTSLMKIMRLRRTIKQATSAVSALFGQQTDNLSALDRLEMLMERVELVKLIFQNEKMTEFVIATIPAIMGINESRRLLKSIREQKIPCKTLIVNQVIGESTSDAVIKMKLNDQERAIKFISSSPHLSDINKIYAPLLDLEVRGLPGLTYFGEVVWSSTFESMNAYKNRRYVLLGGKGGVGKTSTAASLAIQFAQSGKPTLIISTDPAHSLSDSLDQDMSGGLPVKVDGVSYSLWGMEIDIEQAREDIKKSVDSESGLRIDKMMSDVGLGMFAEQFKDLNLGELLDNPPPGTDEAVAIAKVIQFLKKPEYAKFERIVFDTAPTGHTLRLLTLPDFFENIIGKIIQLKGKIKHAADVVTGALGRTKELETEGVITKLEQIKENMEEARKLFRNKDSTEFVIVTIPTIMAVSESERLAKSLKEEEVPFNHLIINQILKEEASQAFLGSRRRDQQRSLEVLREDPELSKLKILLAPLVDLEVRGIPALQYFGSQVWK